MLVLAQIALAAQDAATTAVQEVAKRGMDDAVLGVFGATLGAGIIVLGAALGIGKIASGATEGIARQPEAGGRIFTTMLLACAFIEGGMLLALIVCFLTMWRLT